MNFVNSNYKINNSQYLDEISLPEIEIENPVLHAFDEIIFSLADGKMYNRHIIEQNYDYDEILEDFLKVSKQIYIEHKVREKMTKKK